jgi:protein-tyrosine-phosphatase
VGDPAAQRTQIVLAERGLDGSQHRSQPVTAELLEQYNLILTMEQGQKEALSIEFSQLAGRVFMLSEMIGLTFDIQDPINQSSDEFRATLREIDRILRDGLVKITGLARG